jgi:hypothetical protein
VNPPNILANKVVVIPFLWDLDLPERNTSLTIHRADYDWIRPDQHAGPLAVIPAEDNNVVKAGHRIFGFISITCPECARTRDYLVCFTSGDGGFYAETQEGTHGDTSKIVALLPTLRERGCLPFMPTNMKPIGGEPN